MILMETLPGEEVRTELLKQQLYLNCTIRIEAEERAILEMMTVDVPDTLPYPNIMTKTKRICAKTSNIL